MRVFEEDPGLLEHVDTSMIAKATRAVTTQMVRVRRGPWRPEGEFWDGAELLGLLVIEGFLARCVEVGKNRSVELLGPRDVLRPWQPEFEERFEVSCQATWQAVAPARLAVLDGEFNRIITGLDGVVPTLMARLTRRTRSFAVRFAIAHNPNLAMRLHAFLWHVADRWGERGFGGVLLPVPLEHETLADLVCARRQSVTTALGQLQRRGMLARREDGLWILQSPRLPPRSTTSHVSTLTS